MTQGFKRNFRQDVNGMSDLANNQFFEKVQKQVQAFLHSLKENRSLLPEQMAGVRAMLQAGRFDYESFRTLVPMTSKERIFGNSLHVDSLISERIRDGLKLVPAAGTQSSVLSFRFLKDQSEAAQYQRLSALSQSVWGADISEFFILNAYPTGINIPSGINSIECSAKPEVLKLALRTVHNHFEKLILVCQPHFLRFILENQYLAPEDFRKIYFVVGGTWFPVNFIDHIARHLGADPQEIEARTISLYGVAEVGLGIGLQTPGLQRIRQKIRDANINEAKSCAAPMIFSIDSQHFFLEGVEGSLVVTAFDSSCTIPILRYRLGDVGFLLDRKQSKQLIGDDQRVYFCLSGRVANEDYGGPYSDEIEELLYSDPIFLEKLTGEFVICPDKVLFETRDNAEDLEPLERRIRAKLGSNLPILFKSKPRSEFMFRKDLLRKPQHYAK